MISFNLKREIASIRKKLKAAVLLCAVTIVCNEFLITSTGEDTRKLSVRSDQAQCKWQPPKYNIPSDIDWLKTLVVGFPSGDKRLAFMQMEGLTGWAARDEWAYKYVGNSNHPFIKSNYPHYDGIWGWEGKH